MKKATSSIQNAEISLKQSLIICDQLRGKKLESGKKFLETLIDKKNNLDGKFYPTTAKKFLDMLESAEANAKVKNLTAEKLFIKKIKADKGYRYMRPKSRWRFRGRRVKSSTIQVEVEER
jgi:ribosomal protein L22